MFKSRSGFPAGWLVGLVGLWVAGGLPLAAQTPTFANERYGVDHPRQVLDVWRIPGVTEPRPCILWIHGGGWSSGDKSSGGRWVAALRAAGFVSASTNYRLSGDSTHPAMIHDCKAAVRHLRANAARYGIDPARIGVWGSSAGGHLAALVGTSGDVSTLEGAVGTALGRSSRVQAACDFFGPTNFLEPWHTECTSAESRMTGVCIAELLAHLGEPGWEDEEAQVRSAMPLTFVSTDDPPFYVWHGASDGVVPPWHSQDLFDLLQANSVRSALTIYPGVGHSVVASEAERIVREFFVPELRPLQRSGDCNCDGLVNFADIDAFVAALTSRAAYEAGYRAVCAWPLADVNGDVAINFGDIDEFVTCLAAGVCP